MHNEILRNEVFERLNTWLVSENAYKEWLEDIIKQASGSPSNMAKFHQNNMMFALRARNEGMLFIFGDEIQLPLYRVDGSFNNMSLTNAADE